MKQLTKLRDITGWSVLIIFLLLISSKLFAGNTIRTVSTSQDAVLNYQSNGLDLLQSRNFRTTGAANFVVPNGTEAIFLQDSKEDRKKNEPKNKTGVFYGKKVKEKKVVFCLDASGSMAQSRGVKQPDNTSGVKTKNKRVPDLPDLPANSSKLEIAKWQLKKAILGLNKKQGFNIVFFSNDTKVWQEKRIIPATPKAKRVAFKWIDKIGVGSSTNVYKGLKESMKIGVQPKASKPLKYAADAIYLLSDGQPSGGKIDDPDKLIKKFGEWNKNRKVVVNTFAVGTDTGIGGLGNKAEKFLKRLAKENNGEYIKP